MTQRLTIEEVDLLQKNRDRLQEEYRDFDLQARGLKPTNCPYEAQALADLRVYQIRDTFYSRWTGAKP